MRFWKFDQNKKSNVQNPCWLMIIGGYTIQLSKDYHNPLWEILLINQYKGMTFRVSKRLERSQAPCTDQIQVAREPDGACLTPLRCKPALLQPCSITDRGLSCVCPSRNFPSGGLRNWGLENADMALFNGAIEK